MNIESIHTTVTTRTVDTNYQLAYIKEKAITPAPAPVPGPAAAAPLTFGFGAARTPAPVPRPGNIDTYAGFVFNHEIRFTISSCKWYTPPIGKPSRISTYPRAKLPHHLPNSTKYNAFSWFFLPPTDNLYQISDMCSNF